MIFLDMEFSRVTHEQVRLVCCTVDCDKDGVREFWLRDDSDAQKELKDYLESKKNEIFVAYSAVAEGRSFISLGLNPPSFKWIDLFLEYRLLTNQNDDLLYGDQLVNGEIKRTSKPPPKWERTEEDTKNSFKPTHSLAEATFKLLGEVRNTEHKDAIRDLIISDPDSFTEEEREAIQKYCTEDVVHLRRLFHAMIEKYEELDFPYDSTLKEEMLLRGKYAALTAKMESWGYPIDYDKTLNFSKSVGPLLEECQREINDLFPDIKPFVYDRKDRKFKWNQKVTKVWLKNNVDISRWVKTDGLKKAKKKALSDALDKLPPGKKLTSREREAIADSVDESDFLSLALEAWTKVFDFKHDYPKDNFGAQIVRYLKLKQNLNGFVPGGKKNFWDAVGPDKRVRPYFNIYGSLSSRSQPGSTSFLFLKPAWMRSLCMPPKGKAIVGIDYGSEEYLISALVSGDMSMVEAYKSGDVYLDFAIRAGLAPKNATKDSHKRERNLCKASVLGMSYLMTAIGLSAKLTADTGELVTEEEAQEYIDTFYDVYEDLKKWQDDIQKQYLREKHLKLPCGWTLFGDSDNFRSYVNFNIQGCIYPDARIIVKDMGYQKIKDVSGRSDIQVWDGKKFVRADCVPSGKKKKVIITLRNGQKIECSPDHKFLTTNTNGNKLWKTPSEFAKQDYLTMSDESEDFDCTMKLPNVEKSKANPNMTSITDYSGTKYELGIVLGRLASDGWVGKNGRGVYWIVAEHEKEILNYLKSLIQKFGLEVYEKAILREGQGKKPLYNLRIYSKNLETQLRSIINIKDNLNHPFLWQSKEMLRGFLKGYVDGDGGISSKTVQIAFGKGSRKEMNARELQKAFYVFGIKTRLRAYSYRTNLSISERNLTLFKDKIGFLNPGKNKKLEDLCKGKVFKTPSIGRVERVESVEFTEELIEMYDVVNCPDKTYAADGFITHNTGASILRKAVEFCDDAGLKVIITLHDAIYCEIDSDDFGAIDTLRECMHRAFIHYFDDKESASVIRMDPFAFSSDYEEDSEIVTPKGWKVSVSNKYIDERATAEYGQFKKYFETRGENYL